MATFFVCCRRPFVFLLILFFLSACASKSKNIESTYVSPLTYQSYNCEQIGQEMSRIGRNLAEISGTQDSTSTKDTVAMTVGLVVFWPSLFFLAAGEDHKAEIAKLKGESEALEQSAINKQCTTVIAQRDEAIRLYEKQQQEKKERDALVEAKRQECRDTLGSGCGARDFEAEVDKELAESMALNSVEVEKSSNEIPSPQIAIASSTVLSKEDDVSSESEIYKTKCTKCSNVVTYQAKYSGTLTKCMKCDHQFNLP